MPGWVRSGLVLAMGLAWPGLGQLYSGRPLRALVAFLLTLFVIYPASRILPLLPSWSFPAVFAGFFVELTVFLPVAIDGVLQARHRRPTVWGSWWICILAAIVIWGVLAVEIVALPGYLPLRQFTIPTNSMYPTIMIGDVIVAEMRTWSPDDLEHGDVIVFEGVEEPDKLFTYRIAGMPGDEVALQGGLLVLNGEERAEAGSDESFFVETLGSHVYQVWLEGGYSPKFRMPAIHVPEGVVFVLGDNRFNSRDSRSFGTVRVNTIRGRALRIRWSRDLEESEVRWDRVGTTID